MELTPEGRTIVEDVARRHGFSGEAVTAMLRAVAASGGRMAQFEHSEFGGMGQWSQGGMTMIGDMFNNGLKARVDALCVELAGLVARQPLPPPRSSQSQSQSQGGGGGGFAGSIFGSGGEVSLFVPTAGRAFGGWWPDDLGQPSSTGQQNDIRYAVFPATRRLAIDIAGRMSVYDTLGHRIGGVSQQQSGDASLTFTSQDGLVRLSDLPVVHPDAGPPSRSASAAPVPSPAAAPSPASEPSAATPPAATPSATAEPVTPKPSGPASQPSATAAVPAPPSRPAAVADSADEIFSRIERLADLRGKGILTEDEFTAKKAELLARL